MLLGIIYYSFFMRKLIALFTIFLIIGHSSPLFMLYGESPTEPSTDVSQESSNPIITEDSVDTSASSTDVPVSTETNSVPETDMTDPDESVEPTEAPAEIENTDAPTDSFAASITAPSSASTPLPNRQDPYKLQSQVDEKSGALIFDYPIEVPSGRNGLTPEVHLTYNSQNRDTDSVIAHWWTIAGIPEITRVNRTWVDQFYGQDIGNWILSSSLSWELVFIGNSTFRAKSDDGSWLMYQYDASQQSFVVTDKSGTKYTFWQNASSRQDDPNNAANIYRWLVTSIEDANGNTITFQYMKSQWQIYPYRINYVDGLYALQFDYQYRNDATTSYKTGFAVRTEQQLTNIQFQTSGSVRKWYKLDYVTGQNGRRNLLQKIQLSTYDSNGSWMSYPATTYQYTTNAGANWTTSSLTLPPNTDLNNGQSIPVDFNGDGYTDILTAYQDYNGNVYRYAYMNKWDGTWLSSSSYRPPDYFITFSSGSTIPTGFTVIDINGDLLPDLVQSFQLGSNQPIKNVYINTWAGWSKNNSYSSPTIFAWNNYGYLVNLLSIGDFNGDGLADINAPSGYEYGGIYPATYYNNSGRYAGFRASNTTMYLSTNSSDNQRRYTDINGDGIDDMLSENIYFNGNSCYYDNNQSYLMNGKGDTVYSSNYNSPHQFCPYIWYTMSNDRPDRGGRMWDINNDGLQDLVHATNFMNGNNDHVTHINTWDGWSYNSSYTIPSYLQFSSTDGTVWNLLDLNGDGIQEIVYYNTVYTNTLAKQADILSVINYPTGWSTTVSYKPSTHYRDTSNNLLNPQLPFSVLTVNTVTNTDPYTNISATDTYTYASGTYYYNASQLSDKKFAWFGKVSQKDSVGNTTISYFHDWKAWNASIGEYYDSYAEKIGRMYRQETFWPDSKLYTADIYLWDIDKPGSYGFVFLKSHLHQDFNGQSGHKDRAISYTYDTSTGNVLSKTDHGRVVWNSDGIFSDYTNTNYLDTTISNYSYAFDSSYKKFQVSQEIITDISWNKLRESRYFYDNLSLWQLTRGNQTAEQNWKEWNEYLYTQKNYNGYGLVTGITDARGNTTSYSYDSYYLFPASVTNPMNHTTTFGYNYAVGKVSSSTDSNSFVRETLYDGIGRVLAENTSERDHLASRVPRVTIQYTDTPGSASVTKKIYTSPTNSIESYTYLDGFGRPIQTKTESDDYNSYQTQDIFYNSIGQTSKISQPYFSTGSSRTSAHPNASYYTSYTYDPLYRQLTATNTLGASSTQYFNWSVLQIDANGNRKEYSYDARGYLAGVLENSLWANTTYRHDAFGNLQSLSDSKGNMRNFTYDALGRRITAEDIHPTNDTTFGTYAYSYDSNGNLITKTDPNGVTTSTTYDVLNRPLRAYSTSHNAWSTPTETYQYDTCGKSFLCTITQYSPSDTPVSGHTFAYYKDGLVQTDTHQILQKSYATNYTYDYAGNLKTTTQPNGDIITHTYDNQSRSKQITFNGGYLVRNVGYDLNNTFNFILFGNSVSQFNQYDPAKMNRLERKWAIDRSNKRIQDINYTYDAVGNITQLTDVSQTQTAKTMNYTYDSIYRLLTATATNTADGQNYTHTFTYDAVGNMLSNSAIGDYKYTSDTWDYSSYANSHAVSYINYPSYGVEDTPVSAPTLAESLSFSESATSFNREYYSREDDTAVGYYPGDEIVADVVVVHEETTEIPEVEQTMSPPSQYLDITESIPSTEASVSEDPSPATNDTPVWTTPDETAGNQWNIDQGENPSETEPSFSTDQQTPEIIPTENQNTENSENQTIEANPSLPSDWEAPSPSSETEVSDEVSYSHPSSLNHFFSLLSDIFIPHAYAALPVAPSPTIKPAAGTYTGSVRVTITDKLAGSKIYYTLNWSVPTENSKLYKGAFTVTSTTVVRAISVKDGYRNSTIEAERFTIIPPVAPAPMFDLLGGTYYGTRFLTITNSLPGSSIYYTTNGATPTTSSTLYTGALTLSNSATVRAITVKSGYTQSSMVSQTYTIIQTPEIQYLNASATRITQGSSVQLSWSYTNTPLTASMNNGIGSVLNTYSRTVTPLVTTTYTLTASNAYGTSTRSVTITVDPPVVPTPSFSLLSGNYNGNQTLSLTNTLSGSTMYYTIDGTTPTTSSPVYSTPFTLSSSTTVKVLAVKSGYTNSVIATANYTITQPPVIPTLTASPTTITQGDTTTLNWTLGWSAPATLSIDNGIGSVLGSTSRILTPATTTTYTLTATNSAGTATKQVTITVNPHAPTIPSFTASPATIIVGDPTILNWTVGGGAATLSIEQGVGTVTGTSKTLYPLITTTYTLTATNSTWSATKTVTVTVNLPTAPAPSITPSSGSYTGVQTISMSNTLTDSSIHYTTDGSTPTTASPVYSVPFTLSANTTVKAISVKSGYYNSSATSRAYTITLPTAPAPTTSLTAGNYIGDQTIALSNNLTDSMIHYTTDWTTPTISSPVYSLPFTLSSSTTVRAITVKANYNNSPVTTIAYTITPVAPTPTMSPSGWSSNNSALVTLTTSLAGAIIYYTLDGTTPTTASPVYSGPFTLTSSSIVTAIATKSGYQNSATVSGVFTILQNRTYFTYDRNGNLTQESGRKNALYTWDSDNRMTSSTLTNSDGSQIISTYLYDTGGQRIHEKVIKKTGSTIQSTRETYYPSKDYSESYDGAWTLTKRTEHVFIGGTMVATVEYTPITPGSATLTQNTSYHLTDHLDSTQVTTDTNGNIVELNDYYAFGWSRQSIKSGTFSEQRKYIGEVFDADTGLNYLNARYYNSNYWRFISQDPVFWEVGMTDRGRDALADPQSMNSYSYAQNNPIRFSDPTGESIWWAIWKVFGVVGNILDVFIPAAAYAPAPTTSKTNCQCSQNTSTSKAWSSNSWNKATLSVAQGKSNNSTGNASSNWKNVSQNKIQNWAQTKSINQLNKEIATWKAPKELLRIDPAKIKWEQVHAHFRVNKNTALNIDGSWKHGFMNLSKSTFNWLKSNWWRIIK
jgi:RHS repeat-associated protein